MAFLLLVVAAVAAGLWHKFPRLDSQATAALLRDGDLDGKERQRQLARLVELADAAPTDLAAQWFGALAAVRLEDRAAHARITARLSAAGPAAAPDATTRRDLGLGDPLLANVGAARVAELAGDSTTALQHWRQVAEQCRLQTRALAAELAATALASGR